MLGDHKHISGSFLELESWESALALTFHNSWHDSGHLSPQYLHNPILGIRPVIPSNHEDSSPAQLLEQKGKP